MPAGRFQEVVSREQCAVRTDVFCSRGKKRRAGIPCGAVLPNRASQPAQEEHRSRGSDGSRVPWHAGCRVGAKEQARPLGNACPHSSRGAREPFSRDRTHAASSRGHFASGRLLTSCIGDRAPLLCSFSL
ncbi:hypothetical protein MRX96_049579 [Rhipicephalus microplus]